MRAAAILNRFHLSRRKLIVSAVFFLASVLIFDFFMRGTAGMHSTFVLTSQRAGVEISAPDLVLPTDTTLLVLGVMVIIVAIWNPMRTMLLISSR